MATLNIEGQRVTVDDSFLKMSPDQQHAAVDEIASRLKIAPQGQQRSLKNVVTDIPGEIANAASEALTNIEGVSKRGEQGPIEGALTTAKAVLGVPQLLVSPITGTARSVGGNLMAQGEHAAGEFMAPQIAAKDDLDAMYETAKGDVDMAMSAARPGKVPVAAPKAPVPTITELEAAADAAYKSPEVTGLEVRPHTLRNYSDQAQAALSNEGFDDTVAPKTFAILNKLQKIPPASRVTGQNFNSLRKMLGKAAKSPDPAEREAASMAIEHLDDFIPQIGRSDVLAGDPDAAAAKLEEARGNYSAAKQANKIDRKRVNAELRAASSNSGMNVANTIRQRMADVVLNPKEARGLRPEEIEQAKKIAEGTRTQNAIRTAGNILGGGGGLGTAMVGALGGIATGGPGAAIPLGGFLLRSISNRMTLAQAGRLSEAIRSRAPLASSAAKFQQAATNVQANRTPQAIAGLVIAARNLATNMRSAGFKISVSDLVQALQSPATGDAQEQKNAPRPPGQ